MVPEAVHFLCLLPMLVSILQKAKRQRNTWAAKIRRLVERRATFLPVQIFFTFSKKNKTKQTVITQFPTSSPKRKRNKEDHSFKLSSYRIRKVTWPLQNNAYLENFCQQSQDCHFALRRWIFGPPAVKPLPVSQYCCDQFHSLLLADGTLPKTLI